MVLIYLSPQFTSNKKKCHIRKRQSSIYFSADNAKTNQFKLKRQQRRLIINFAVVITSFSTSPFGSIV